MPASSPLPGTLELPARHGPTRLAAALAVALALGIVLGIAAGPYPLLPFDAAAAEVLWQLRVPRVLAAALVGGVLGLGGAVMQGWFRNPLVEPGLLGVSAGAAAAAAWVLLWLPRDVGAELPWLLSAAAFLGSTGTVWVLARLRDRLASDNGLVLAGIAINALVASSVGVLATLAPAERLKSFAIWGLASFDAVAPDTLLPLAVGALWMAARLLPLGTPLNALGLGAAAAGHLGVDVPRLERRLLLGLAVGVGAATAAVGPLTFVGLLAPNLLRSMGHADHRRLLPLATVLGAALAVWAELGARVLLAPRELPAGVLTQFAGALLFAQLLLRRRGAAGT